MEGTLGRFRFDHSVSSQSYPQASEPIIGGHRCCGDDRTSSPAQRELAALSTYDRTAVDFTHARNLPSLAKLGPTLSRLQKLISATVHPSRSCSHIQYVPLVFVFEDSPEFARLQACP